MTANGDGVTVSGQIVRQERKHLVTVEGVSVGPAGSIQAAAERLIQALRSRLPRSPSSWGVQAGCSGEALSLAVGNLAGGRGGGSLHPCAARILRGRRLESLDQALGAFAQVIGHCCG